jgi:hypothetical protein
MWPRWEKPRGGMPVAAAGRRAAVGPAEGERPVVRGRQFTGGGLGYARRLPRGSAPARAALPPGPRPRAGSHGEPAATTARAGERANGQRPRAPGRRRQAAVWSGEDLKMAPARFGEKCAPRTTNGNDGMSPGTRQERFASLRDGLRPHLTEPVRRLVRDPGW